MIDALYNAGAANLGAAWPVVWSLIKIVCVLLPLLISVAYLTLWERKAIAWTQIRPGPNRTGPYVMRLGWKIFIPVTLIWLLVVGAWMMSPLNIWK